jgi:hypothetical protein
VKLKATISLEWDVDSERLASAYKARDINEAADKVELWLSQGIVTVEDLLEWSEETSITLRGYSQ